MKPVAWRQQRTAHRTRKAKSRDLHLKQRMLRGLRADRWGHGLPPSFGHALAVQMVQQRVAARFAGYHGADFGLTPGWLIPACRP